MAVLAYSPLSLGLLTGKMGPEWECPPGDGRGTRPRFSRENRTKVSRMRGEMRPVAERHGLTVGQLVIAWTASQVPHQTSPLDFDQRHKLAVSMGLAFGKDQGPKWGRYSVLSDVDFNVLYNIATGTPFTPTGVTDEVTQLSVAQQPTGAQNSRTSPATQSLDFKLTKALRLSSTRLSAYIWVLNAFNTNNSINVYSGTGSAYTTGFLNTESGRSVAQRLAGEGIDAQSAYALATQNQSLFSIPRTIRFGVRTDF